MFELFDGLARTFARLRRTPASVVAINTIALLIPVSMLGAMPAAPEVTMDGGRFGAAHVEQPHGAARGYTVLFSDRGGWTSFDQAALDAIESQGVLAVGVDTDIYLSHIAAGVHSCGDLVGDVEGLSQRLQRAQPEGDYHFPILAGFGAGGALAQLILKGAPVNTIAGAASIDPSAAAPLACSGAAPEINGFWSVGLTPSASAQTRATLEAARAAGAAIDVRAIGGDNDSQSLAALIEPHLESADVQGLASIPLVELPSDHPSRLLAVVMSGDGGWRDIDKTLAERLQHDGVSVVGWDSLRYFWRKKTPERTAEDLAAVIQSYRAKWGADKVALVGYSFGADVLPAAYALLPALIKRQVAQVSLLGLESKADWEIRIAGWLGAAPSNAATPVEPALQAMPARLIQCFYGAAERETDCPSLKATGAEVIKMEGSHHFGGDYAGIAHRILDGFERRSNSAG
jgi:type IV secretory pathway VirJ component